MFYEMRVSHTIYVHPRYFGPKLASHIETEMRHELEGRIRKPLGQIILLKSVDKVSPGLLNDSGHAEITASCAVIVCRPFANEVVEGVVTNVNQTGFFVEAGPLTVYVSRFSMPEGYIYDEDGFTETDSLRRIDKRDEVRVKIKTVRLERSLFAVGSIQEDYLGLIHV